MIKKYIKPETVIILINISNMLLIGSEKKFDPDKDHFDPGLGGEEDAGSIEYSRDNDDNNRGNVWDNAW